jgi:hypothetical protein
MIKQTYKIHILYKKMENKMIEFGDTWFEPKDIQFVKIHSPSIIDKVKYWRVYVKFLGVDSSWAEEKFTNETSAREAAKKLVAAKEYAQIIALAKEINQNV